MWWYYAGHGATLDLTNIVCNKGVKKHEFYPLERKLKKISEENGAFVIATYDCCRAPGNRNGNQKQVTSLTGTEDDDFEDEEESAVTATGNSVTNAAGGGKNGNMPSSAFGGFKVI